MLLSHTASLLTLLTNTTVAPSQSTYCLNATDAYMMWQLVSHRANAAVSQLLLCNIFLCGPFDHLFKKDDWSAMVQRHEQGLTCDRCSVELNGMCGARGRCKTTVFFFAESTGAQHAYRPVFFPHCLCHPQWMGRMCERRFDIERFRAVRSDRSRSAGRSMMDLDRAMPLLIPLCAVGAGLLLVVLVVCVYCCCCRKGGDGVNKPSVLRRFFDRLRDPNHPDSWTPHRLIFPAMQPTPSTTATPVQMTLEKRASFSKLATVQKNTSFRSYGFNHKAVPAPYYTRRCQESLVLDGVESSPEEFPKHRTPTSMMKRWMRQRMLAKMNMIEVDQQLHTKNYGQNDEVTPYK